MICSKSTSAFMILRKNRDTWASGVVFLTSTCSVLEPGVGIEPTSVIPFSLDAYCGLLRAVLLSAARRLHRSAFGVKSLTKDIPTPALPSSPSGNCDDAIGHGRATGG